MQYMQPQTPFISGLKEGLMEGPAKGTVALALKVMDHKMEMQKLEDYRKLKELLLQKDFERERRENLKLKLENALKMAAEARAQGGGFDPQVPMEEANKAFREITGSDLPFREIVAPGQERPLTPSQIDAAQSGVPGVTAIASPTTRREYLVPRSASEIKADQLAQLYDAKQRLMEASMAERLELAKVAAMLKERAANAKANAPEKRDKSKLRDDIRQHYGMKMKMFTDPITGGVLPEKKQDYADLLEDMERDLRWLDAGYKTRYETGGRSLTPLTKYLRGAKTTQELEDMIFEAYKQKWAPEEIAWALDETDLGQELKKSMKNRGEPVVRRKVTR
jgi:hypothetical protein